MKAGDHAFMVGERRIGRGTPIFIVAEAGVNHNGDPALARRLVDAAAECGADAVKFQTFTVDSLLTRGAPKASYQVDTTGAGESQREMLARLELGPGELALLHDRAAKHGLVFFSAPFDEKSADALEALGLPLFKIPSGEITNLPLLRHVAAKGRPIILSTGMASLEEVEQAVAAIRAAGDPPLAVLHCLSAYPAPPSLDPPAFAAMVRAIRNVESALGDGVKRPMPSEADTRRVARKSLVAAHALGAGRRLTAGDVVVKRPGTGIPPGELPRALGRKVTRDVAADEVIPWEALGEP